MDEEITIRQKLPRAGAYLLLAASVLAMVYNLGEQRGYVAARDEACDRENQHAAQNDQLVTELNALRDRLGVPSPAEASARR
jgi:hypothetical protein